MTPDVVKYHAGGRSKPKFYLFALSLGGYDKDRLVVVRLVAKNQVCCIWPEPWGWVNHRLKKIDSQSAEMYINMGRKYIDLTEPTEADIQFLRTNTKKP